MEIHLKHLDMKRSTSKLAFSENPEDILHEMSSVLLNKCIALEQTSIPVGYDLSQITINSKELLALAKSNDKFQIPTNWFIRRPSGLNNPLVRSISQLHSPPSQDIETSTINLSELNVLSVLLDFSKSTYFDFYKLSAMLTIKDIEHGTFELLLGLLLFNKPNFNIKYVISDKIRLHYGINKKKSIELAEYYSIVPLNNTVEVDEKDIQNIGTCGTLQEFIDVLMRYVVLNKDPFLLKFILIHQFKSNREWVIRQYKLLFFILLEKTVYLLESVQDKALESDFNKQISTTYSSLCTAVSDEQYHDTLLEHYRQWMCSIFKYTFTSEDTKKGFLPCFMLVEISKVQLHLFDNNDWKCKDVEYQSFITWFNDLFSCNQRYIAWGHAFATISNIDGNNKLFTDALRTILSQKDTKIHSFSPIAAQFYLNLSFKQVVVEYQVASESCVDLLSYYFQCCDTLLQVEYTTQLKDTWTQSSIAQQPHEWTKYSIIQLVELVMKQANEHIMHTLISIMRPEHSDLNEKSLFLFLEALESTFIKDWSVRFEAVSNYIRPQVFWKRHVDQLIQIVFSKVQGANIEAFGSVFNDCCSTVERIHAFLSRVDSEYALLVKLPDLSWFLTNCLENWIFKETTALVQIGHACYSKDSFEVINGLNSDGVYSFMTIANRLVDCILSIKVPLLGSKVVHYLITSLSPSFYEIGKLYLRNPLLKSAKFEIQDLEPIILTVVSIYVGIHAI